MESLRTKTAPESLEVTLPDPPHYLPEIWQKFEPCVHIPQLKRGPPDLEVHTGWRSKFK